MSKTKIILVFLAGAIFGAGSLIAGIPLWNRTEEWLSYTRPDAATVEKIERIAARQQIDMTDTQAPLLPKKATLRLGEYRRWYVQGKEDGRDVIWGEWDKEEKPGIYLGHRRFPPGSFIVLDGGCGRVHLRYDLARQRLDTFMVFPCWEMHR